MTVRDILEQWLKANGYDGLVADGGECGCELGDLAPCSEYFGNCLAAYRGPSDPNAIHPSDWAMYSSKEARDKAAQTTEGA